MKKELKDKWIKALRSGSYSQSHGILRNKIGFCCLGVLCDVDSPDWEREYMHNYRHISGRKFSLNGGDFGLSDEAIRECVEMNDTGKRFEEIANYIEDNIPGE